MVANFSNRRVDYYDRAPGRFEDAKKFQRAEYGKTKRGRVKEHVPRQLEIAET